LEQPSIFAPTVAGFAHQMVGATGIEPVTYRVKVVGGSKYANDLNCLTDPWRICTHFTQFPECAAMVIFGVTELLIPAESPLLTPEQIIGKLREAEVVAVFTQPGSQLQTLGPVFGMSESPPKAEFSRPYPFVWDVPKAAARWLSKHVR
jgi:hypothetical protein